LPAETKRQEAKSPAPAFFFGKEHGKMPTGRKPQNRSAGYAEEARALSSIVRLISEERGPNAPAPAWRAEVLRLLGRAIGLMNDDVVRRVSGCGLARVRERSGKREKTS
jgi:hypothetical protein